MTLLDSFVNLSGPVSISMKTMLSNTASTFTNKDNTNTKNNKRNQEKIRNLVFMQQFLGFVLYIISLYILVRCECGKKNIVPIIILSQLFPFIYVPYKLITGCEGL